MVFSDPAVLEASLCVTESRRSLLYQGKIDYASVGRHKQNAIQIISARLNDPTLSTIDSTMNAVMTLAYSEVCQ